MGMIVAAIALLIALPAQAQLYTYETGREMSHTEGSIGHHSYEADSMYLGGGMTSITGSIDGKSFTDYSFNPSAGDSNIGQGFRDADEWLAHRK